MSEKGDTENKKSGCFGRLIKCLLWCVLGIVALVVVLVAALPLWISPVATGVANSVVPQLTGTAFHIDRFYVNPWTGTVRINGVKLSNPEGFGDSPAFSMTSFTLDMHLMKLFSNTLHIKELLIEDPFASYYSHDGVNNFDAILANVNKALGEKDKAEVEKEEEKLEKEVEKAEIKVIIDHLRISGTKVKLMEASAIPPLPIMTIELSDIGKKSDGATLEEAWKELSDAFMKGMGSVGDGLNALGGMLGEGASSAAGATVDAAKSAKAGAADATKAAAGAVGNGAKAAAGAVGDGAKAAADAVGDTAKQATEGVKNLFKGFGK